MRRASQPYFPAIWQFRFRPSSDHLFKRSRIRVVKAVNPARNEMGRPSARRRRPLRRFARISGRSSCHRSRSVPGRRYSGNRYPHTFGTTIRVGVSRPLHLTVRKKPNAVELNPIDSHSRCLGSIDIRIGPRDPGPIPSHPAVKVPHAEVRSARAGTAS